MNNMEDAIGGAAAQGDLADIVARASAMAAAAQPSTSHHHHQQPPPPPPSLSAAAAADHISCSSAAAMPTQIVMNHPPAYYEEDSARLAFMFEAPPSAVDPYLASSSSATAPPCGAYWQLLPPQISQQHDACFGRGMVMNAATADVEGDDATRSPPLMMPAAATAAHQMMKRKNNDVKKVVCIPAPPATSSRPGGGGEVIPSDLWAWRKYGQKPIKGSPYPRGYYRCSSSKGCMARKQVERSRSDPNMLVITYTAEHNHPWPMQRNVLAGYSRTHTHVPTNCKTKKNCCRVDPTSSMSPSSKNDLECQYSTNMMESNAADAYGITSCTAIGALNSEGGVMPSSCNGIQPAADEVFAELEELEPGNNPVMNANVYSRGVAYEWNKL